MLWRPPRATLFSYTTLFRSAVQRSVLEHSRSVTVGRAEASLEISPTTEPWRSVGERVEQGESRDVGGRRFIKISTEQRGGSGERPTAAGQRSLPRDGGPVQSG